MSEIARQHILPEDHEVDGFPAVTAGWCHRLICSENGPFSTCVICPFTIGYAGQPIKLISPVVHSRLWWFLTWSLIHFLRITRLSSVVRPSNTELGCIIFAHLWTSAHSAGSQPILCSLRKWGSRSIVIKPDSGNGLFWSKNFGSELCGCR